MESVVYVLDDEKPVLEIITRSLEVLVPGIEIRTFSRARDLIEAEGLDGVDLFILDISLFNAEEVGPYDGRLIPNMLPERCKLASFLFISGVIADADFELVPSGIVYDFMSKPWSAHVLQNRVRNLLRLAIENKALLYDKAIGELRLSWREQIDRDRKAIEALRDHPLDLRAICAELKPAYAAKGEPL